MATSKAVRCQESAPDPVWVPEPANLNTFVQDSNPLSILSPGPPKGLEELLSNPCKQNLFLRLSILGANCPIQLGRQGLLLWASALPGQGGAGLGYVSVPGTSALLRGTTRTHPVYLHQLLPLLSLGDLAHIYPHSFLPHLPWNLLRGRSY